MSKFLEKKEAIMITNKPAHEHKFNSDCFARFLVYLLCNFLKPCDLLFITLYYVFVAESVSISALVSPSGNLVDRCQVRE